MKPSATSNIAEVKFSVTNVCKKKKILQTNVSKMYCNVFFDLSPLYFIH